MRIRPLAEADQAAVEALCAEEPEYDLFLLANLDRLSPGQNLAQYWGQFDDSGQLVGALMRYHVLWYVHDGPGADLAAFAQTIEAQAQPHIVVNDNLRTAESLVPLLERYQVVLDLPGRLRRLRPERFVAPPALLEARRATLDDAERLIEFYAQAPDDVRRGPDSVRRSLGGGRRTYIAEANGELAACALTMAELPTVAMMGGVHAPAPYREGQWLASVLSALARSLLAEGRRACLVTRDPLLDEICDRLGFDDLGPWRMVHLELGEGPDRSP